MGVVSHRYIIFFNLTTGKIQDRSGYLQIGNFKFESVLNFIYLGSLINDEIDIYQENYIATSIRIEVGGWGG